MYPNNKLKLWAILNNESQPMALVKAVTEFGAKKKYSDRTGQETTTFHVELIVFKEGCYEFSESE